MIEDDPLLEEDYSFQCPYCWTEIFVRLEASGGRKQSFVYDCHVCCRPLNIRVEFDSEGGIADFSAQQE